MLLFSPFPDEATKTSPNFSPHDKAPPPPYHNEERNVMTTERMVEIARFEYASEASTLMALLRSEGINCYLRNEYTSQLMGGYVDLGGARVEILEGDAARAMEVMEAGGYELPADNEEAQRLQRLAEWTRNLPFVRRLPTEQQVLALFIVLSVCLGLLVYAATALA